MTVEWRWIEGCEGRYAVSSNGEIRSHTRAVPKILAGGSSQAGYRHALLQIDGRQITVMHHTVIAAAFLGPRPAGMQINHIDGDKKNNAASNLEYITPKANQQHSSRLGLIARGSRNGWAKLTEDDVAKIRARHKAGATGAAIARELGLCKSTTCRIINGSAWRHSQTQHGEMP